jgi:pimeloyl-ACP methyl ester carboxylesterase
MPGFGYSSEPNVVWNLDDFVNFILNFIKELNLQELDLIGHSNGGRIIIKLMNRPDLNIKINNIILIGSAGIVHSMSFSKRMKVTFFKCCKKIIELKPIKLLFPNLLNNLKNIFGSEDYKNASPMMKSCLVNLVNEDLREFMPNIKVPTLLIWGENDTATPISDAEIMKQLIPNSGLVKIENCSHYVFLEKPVYVNKIINNFLTRGDNT